MGNCFVNNAWCTVPFSMKAGARCVHVHVHTCVQGGMLGGDGHVSKLGAKFAGKATDSPNQETPGCRWCHGLGWLLQWSLTLRERRESEVRVYLEGRLPV